MNSIAPLADGVRVVEIPGSGIAAAYAGWLLGHMGAVVTRIASSAVAGADPVDLALKVLARGKLAVAAPTTADGFDALLVDCDILLCDDPAALEEIAGPLASLQSRIPRLVIGIATIFGLDGPYAGRPGTGLDAQALSGVAWALGEPGLSPLSLPPGIVEHQSGVMLAAGCLMALAVRDAAGTGRTVDIALSDVLASQVAGNCRFYIHHGMRWHRSGRRASDSGGAYPYVILPCKDGEVCICGRTRDEWQRLVQVMGNPEWTAEPRYQDLRAMGRQYPEEVDALLLPWLAQHTMAELEAVALANNLIVSPIRSFADVLATPQFTAGGFLVDAEIAGHTVRVPSLPFQVVEARVAEAPNLVSGLLRGPAPAADKGIDPARPLAGLRVLDFGWVWSAPWVGTMLGELGAEVIKVEHALRPDNSRLSGRIFRDGVQVEGPSKEMSPMFHQINHGKLGITLNAKEPRAVALLKDLVAKSHLVIENMSPGSMERSHLGYNDLRAVNPGIVMLAMSAAGQFGSLAKMRAYAPTMSSFVGLEAMVGYPGEASIGALNFGLGDPNGSAHALVAVLAALRRAKATGRGCYIDLSQVEALLDTLSPYLLDTQVQGRQSPTIGNRHPSIAPHGIYPTGETDAWATIAVADDAQWQALTAMIGADWAQDKCYASAAGRLAAVAVLDTAVAAWTATQPRDALCARLRSIGIASSPVLSVEQAWADPQFAARKISSAVEIPVYGSETLFRAPWNFSDFTPRLDRCGPLLGEHNDRIFGDLLGLAPAEIAELKQSGVIA